MSDYIKHNKANWDDRAPLHAASEDYAVQAFIDDQRFLSDVVRFDLPLLGDIAGLRGIHLQCHIGTDTLSLARLGAQMSGLDFSSASLHQAAELAKRCDTAIDYIEAEIDNVPQVLPAGGFELVYTGIGALCWLPSIDRWARTVSHLLKPGGRLFIREGHPLLGTLNESRQDLLSVEHPYFERETPLAWDDPGTYVETDQVLTATLSHEWNHGMGEIISALLKHGLEITGLVEHQSIPWDALPGQMVCDAQGEYRLKHAPWRLPLSYTLQAIKRRG